jgi:hypothetical protein
MKKKSLFFSFLERNPKNPKEKKTFSPSRHRLYSQQYSTLGRSNNSSLCILAGNLRVGNLKLEAADNGGKQAVELCFCETHANARARAVQEGQVGEVAFGAAAVGALLAHPALGVELVFAEVDCHGRDYHVCAGGDELAQERGVPGGNAACEGDWGVETEDFVADCMEVG